ncbi:MAG TPA: DinB family protein [Thermoanaerobaculia bacterium]|nr:DinB family protein [Thermoanaerobaculia bacterium]
MTTITTEKTELSRILDEGYGPGAWHGPDLKAALADVGPELAFWRPAPERHNIAEIAIHHAFYVRSVRGQLSGTTPEPFVLEGEDWFDVSSLSWPEIQAVVEKEQARLAEVAAELEPSAERFNLVLGITCHAIYHAGQVQLLKKLHG